MNVSTSTDSGTRSALRVSNLRVHLSVNGNEADVVEDVAFDLAPGETLGVVGESGSGKSMTALSLLRMQPRAAEIITGKVEVDGTDLLALPDKQLRKIRGG